MRREKQSAGSQGCCLGKSPSCPQMPEDAGPGADAQDADQPGVH